MPYKASRANKLKERLRKRNQRHVAKQINDPYFPNISTLVEAYSPFHEFPETQSTLNSEQGSQMPARRRTRSRHASGGRRASDDEDDTTYSPGISVTDMNRRPTSYGLRKRFEMFVELLMECEEEDLEPSQVAAYKQALEKHESVKKRIRNLKEEQARQHLQVQHQQPKPQTVVSQSQMVTSTKAPAPTSGQADVIIIGETPPKQLPASLPTQSASANLFNPTPQQVYKFVNLPGQSTNATGSQWVIRPLMQVMPQQNSMNQPIRPASIRPKGTSVLPASKTMMVEKGRRWRKARYKALSQAGIRARQHQRSASQNEAIQGQVSEDCEVEEPEPPQVQSTNFTLGASRSPEPSEIAASSENGSPPSERTRRSLKRRTVGPGRPIESNFIAPSVQQIRPASDTSSLQGKRPHQGTPEPQYVNVPKKRIRRPEDDVGALVPLDEYYYGKKEGDPTYNEMKGEFRFKCWYCEKMLYSNVKAMMHMQGHIDSEKQQNLDLSDLTQCKHCYKQFDTPFEMQTHIEKVHMNNANVLMCRICEKDHDSRQSLTSHMRLHHNACEMPYICQLCHFRSSMYSDVVDHFKKKHEHSDHLLCLYCLRTFHVKFVSMGWGQTQNYYHHLLRHQSKTNAKKCQICKLTFFNSQDVKGHRKKDHMANQKGVIGMSAKYTTPDQVMIRVPESGLVPKQLSVKSLNAPAVSKVSEHRGLRYPRRILELHCFECKMIMGTLDHYKKYIQCSMCRFATSCGFAYANHMMGFHSGQMTSLNLNIPWERPLPGPMYCLCGFGSRYGNKIANHLVFCTKRSCYKEKPVTVQRDERADEEQDPRRKPGASLLDVLGLVKKPNILSRRRFNSGPKELPDSTVDEEQKTKGPQKWLRVRLRDSKQTSRHEVIHKDRSRSPSVSDESNDANNTDSVVDSIIAELNDSQSETVNKECNSTEVIDLEDNQESKSVESEVNKETEAKNKKDEEEEDEVLLVEERPKSTAGNKNVCSDSKSKRKEEDDQSPEEKDVEGETASGGNTEKSEGIGQSEDVVKEAGEPSSGDHAGSAERTVEDDRRQGSEDAVSDIEETSAGVSGGVERTAENDDMDISEVDIEGTSVGSLEVVKKTAEGNTKEVAEDAVKDVEGTSIGGSDVVERTAGRDLEISEEDTEGTSRGGRKGVERTEENGDDEKDIGQTSAGSPGGVDHAGEGLGIGEEGSESQRYVKESEHLENEESESLGETENPDGDSQDKNTGKAVEERSENWDEHSEQDVSREASHQEDSVKESDRSEAVAKEDDVSSAEHNPELPCPSGFSEDSKISKEDRRSEQSEESVTGPVPQSGSEESVGLSTGKSEEAAPSDRQQQEGAQSSVHGTENSGDRSEERTRDRSRSSERSHDVSDRSHDRDRDRSHDRDRDRSHDRDRDRSHDRDRDRSHDRDRDRSHDGDRDRSHDRDHSRDRDRDRNRSRDSERSHDRGYDRDRERREQHRYERDRDRYGRDRDRYDDRRHHSDNRNYNRYQGGGNSRDYGGHHGNQSRHHGGYRDNYSNQRDRYGQNRGQGYQGNRDYRGRGGYGYR